MLSVFSRLCLALMLLCAAGLGACARGPGVGPAAGPDAAAPEPSSAQEAIRELILAEGRGVVSQDLAALMGIWATDAVITDAKHTPDDRSDDAHWRGRDGIRSRYVVLVFPGNPQTASATDITISVEGDRATATSTTIIGGEVSPGGDRWTFARREGRWWITGLTYNLEPK